MQPQLWIQRGEQDDELRRGLFESVRVTLPRAKPDGGGLWTSTYLEDGRGSDWVRFCAENGWGGATSDDARFRSCYLLHPKPDVRIYMIRGVIDLQRLCDRHGHCARIGDSAFTSTFPHWEAVAACYDGVRLTEAGQWQTRLSDPLNLYGWDCESTLWFRWAFERVEALGQRTFVYREVYDDEMEVEAA